MSGPIHVFVSFRGDDDTRKFIDGLWAALERKGLRIFGDDKKLETGDSHLPPHLLQAIEESWICIVVFSKNSASSVWCLEELSWIADRNLREQNIVIPVFYDVNPFPAYKEAFAEHEERFGGDLDKLLEWRQAVTQLASLSGWDVRKDSESEIIQKIARDIQIRIDDSIYDPSRFVGMQDRVEKVKKLLDLGSEDVVRVLGICGMGGLGKTTITRVLYKKIFHYFDASCFLQNVSDCCSKYGIQYLQEFLSARLKIEVPEMRHRKCLIVLDGANDVQDIQELKLVEKSEWFGGGSRIIITTRDEGVLQMIAADDIYKPELLTKDEALRPFYEYTEEDNEEMAFSVLEYADGLPLAIVTLGLCLRRRSFGEWRNAMQRIKEVPRQRLMHVLKKSFNELDNMNKEMFLDIACFFAGKDINYVKEILHDCGFSVEIGIKLLIEKSLMTISNRRIQMHNLLHAMGRDIVRRESYRHRLKRPSRLWLFNDINNLMEQNRKRAMKRVKAIVLDLEEPEWNSLRLDALSKMKNLRLLIFRNMKFSGSLNNLPSKLRYVSWHQYPFTHLPSNFQSDTLVRLILHDSSIIEVWKGKMVLPKLRTLNLRGSKTLIKTPDFGGVPNLERLNLEGCIRLLQLHPSIANLSKLKFLNMRNCINLVKIPLKLFDLKSLEILNLADCSKLAHCLRFSPLKRSIEVKLLCIWHCPFLEKLLYFLLYVLPEQKNYHEFICCCLIYLICTREVKLS